MAPARPSNQPLSNLYIRNLPQEFSDEKLREVFGAFGQVDSVSFMGAGAGGPVPTGLVRFSTTEAWAYTRPLLSST